MTGSWFGVRGLECLQSTVSAILVSLSYHNEGLRDPLPPLDNTMELRT